MALKITMPEVFNMLNWDYKLLSASKHEYRTTCPNCGHKNLEINDFVGQCWNCSTKFNAVSFIAAVYNTDTKSAYKMLIKDGLVETDPSMQQVKYNNNHGIEENPMADISERNKANNIIIDSLTLSDPHKKDLENRGVDVDTFLKLGYRSYPTDKILRFNLAQKVVDSGVKVKGIPGLYIDEKSNSPIMCWRKKGILVPYRDIHFNLQGFQNRKDSDVLEKDEDGKLENKYDYVSSGGKKEGTSSTSFVHYACKFYTEWKTKEVWPRLGYTVFLTEGAMKADIAHYFSGLPFIAIPGVSARLHLGKELEKMKKRGVTKVYDCFDMDYLKNEHVAKAREAIQQLCESKGINYEMILWDAEYKGIDDYLKYLHENNNLDSFISRYK